MSADEPSKKMRKSSVAPLERPEGSMQSPLPDLPEDLKTAQENMALRVPSPPKQSKPESGRTPRGRVHAEGPIIPPSTKPKGIIIILSKYINYSLYYDIENNLNLWTFKPLNTTHFCI